MAILWQTPGEGIGPQSLITLQCDVCCPPFLSTNRLDELARAGWRTTLLGEDLDVCHVCTRRLPRSQHVPRSRRDLVADRGGRLPNLLVVGAAKCGTNSLHSYLHAHPEISMSAIKEPQFFSDPRGVEWVAEYRSYFDPEAKVTGESSTAYTRYPVVPGVPERVAALAPGVRVIYMVRDPVERAISSYVEERMNDNDYRPFDEAFADMADSGNPYVAASRYALQLQRYLDVLPAKQILVVDLGDLESDPNSTMRRIYAFVGVDSEFEAPELGKRLNTREHKREYPSAVRLLRTSPILKWAYRLSPETRERVLGPMRRALSRPITRPVPDDELRRRLQSALGSDAARLREMTGQDFGGWSV